ncbi:MAG: thioredoxin family protein [bacterium]|nr:thioredoxin family protein [bacterium]
MKNLIFVLALLPNLLQAQILEPSKWSYELSNPNAKAGDEVELIFNVTIDDEWYLYSSSGFDPDLGPVPTTFEYELNDTFELIDSVKPINHKIKYDEIWAGDIAYFIGKAQFRQKIQILKDDFVIKGAYEFQVCTDVTGKCIPGDGEFEVKGDVLGKSGNDEVIELDNIEDEGLIWFMLIAFGTGLAALVTPCVFPMIPMTVSFFLKDDNKDHKTGYRKGIIFGISIIAIYTILGTAFAAILGPDGLNAMATHWFPNTFIFIIFIIFAMSFLGLFEITLPSAFVNKIDAKADKGGLVGVFFMAFTLALVSFSCTVPIVGSVLVLSAGGAFVKPILGMLAFSLAFALPFSLFAIFPAWLKSLPKSGGWLNSVKVVLGFIELALALKFLSIADQAYHWHILDREIYLALWIVIATLLGFYLLGKIRMPHDSKSEHTSVMGLMGATLVFSFVVYLVPGMFGAPLKELAGYLPPVSSMDFNISASNSGLQTESISEKEGCEPPKYTEFLKMPHGIQGYFDYDQALACARAQNKPLFIDFTGHSCVNCRKMEERVWPHPEVLRRLKEDFVVVGLYIDDKNDLPENEWVKSSYDGKMKKSIGKKNADFQITRYKNNAQPYYVILDENEKLLVKPKAYDLNVSNFVQFLDKAKEAYNK